MSMSENMVRRKSIRSFSQEPLEESVIEELVDYISGLEAPDTEIDWDFDTLPYLDMVKIGTREPGVKAPHYLVLRAERKNFCLQNTGYIGELAALHMAEKGIGSCWVAGVRITGDFVDSLPYVISIAFGKPLEPFRQSAAEAKRREFKEFVFGDMNDKTKPLMEAARLAPSSLNRQPLSYLLYESKLHIFRKKAPLNNPVISYLQCIDAGVAMAHICEAAKEQGIAPRIGRVTPEPQFGKNIYQATVYLEN